MYSVTDTCSQNATKNCTIVIYEPLTCNQTITLPCLYNGKTLADTVAFSATGGKPPYEWVLTPIGSSKALPNGLLQKKPPNGVGNGSTLYGTITENGTYNFTATVTDSLGNKCSQNHTIVVYPKLVIATPSPLPVAYVGSNYSVSINSTTGKPCYTWTLNSTSVNPQDFGNLKIANGTCDSSILSGIPKKVGNYTVVVVATDSCGQTANKTYTIEVKDNKILSCLKEIWVEVGYMPGVHKCNEAKYNIFANNEQIMVSNLNNSPDHVSEGGGIIDWKDNPAGAANIYGYANGNGSESSFSSPSGIAVASNGNVTVADKKNNLIRKIVKNASSTNYSYGSLSLLDFGKITANVTTLAGNLSGSNFADGNGMAASFSEAEGVAVDGNGTIYVADTGNNRIRTITPSGTVSTLAGNGTAGFGDGVGTAAVFSGPGGIAVDGNGTIYVADTGNNRIRMITPSGTVSTLAGNGTTGFGDGVGTAAVFSGPRGIAVDGNGTIYVADTGNNRIRKIASIGTVSTLAGNGTAGFGDGVGTAAIFSGPRGIAVNGNGTIYVADTGNNRIRKIASIGTVSTLAGNGTAGFGDGVGTTAVFSGPRGIAVDGNGTIYVADAGNHRIRMISSGNVTTTLAGVGTFMLPEPYKSTQFARYNRVLISGKTLEDIVKNTTSSNITFTARCALGSCLHDNDRTGVGTLKVFTTNSTRGIFPPADPDSNTNDKEPVKTIPAFKANVQTTINVCKTTQVNQSASLQTLSFQNFQSSPPVSALASGNSSSFTTVTPNIVTLATQQNPLLQISSFRISNYEITNQQYANFLNASAQSDPNQLYNPNMANVGIQRSSTNGVHFYTVDFGLEDYPVTYVSWFDAARYANWLANGKPNGPQGSTTTEDGAYFFGAAPTVRNAINPNTGAPPVFWLLNESEWYTSAYVKTDGSALWTYPTQSNAVPDSSGATLSNFANFGGVFGETTPVGFFDQSPGPFGTFDQAGNVREWTESLDTSSGAPMRIIRGGSWADPASSMRADESHVADPTLKDDKTGFRIGGAP